MTPPSSLAPPRPHPASMTTPPFPGMIPPARALAPQKWVRGEEQRREREKQARVRALEAEARQGSPTPVDLRAGAGGDAEFAVVGRVEGPYEAETQEAFAVVHLKGHQYKVTADDVVYVDRMRGVEVNDVVELRRVLLLGSAGETVIGRPVVPGARVTAVVEEHFLDGKRVTFKFKRRKGYKRLYGSRHELTTLRIRGIRSG